MVDQVMVRLNKETTKRLKKLKIVKRETYDEVINRIIDFYDENKKDESEQE